MVGNCIVFCGNVHNIEDW